MENRFEEQKENETNIPSVIDLFKNTFTFYKNNFFYLISISATLFIPTIVLLLNNSLFFQAAIFFLNSFLVLFISLLLTVVVHEINTKRKKLTILTLKSSILLFIPFVWISLMQTIIISGAFVPLIVPGIITFILFYFSGYSLIIEEKKGLDALLRSRHLVSGFLGNIFGKIIALIIFYIIITMLIIILLTIIISENIASDIASIFLTPFSAIYSYFLFISLVKEKPLEIFNSNDKRRFYKILGFWGIIATFFIIILIITSFVAPLNGNELLTN